MRLEKTLGREYRKGEIEGARVGSGSSEESTPSDTR